MSRLAIVLAALALATVVPAPAAADGTTCAPVATACVSESAYGNACDGSDGWGWRTTDAWAAGPAGPAVGVSFFSYCGLNYETRGVMIGVVGPAGSEYVTWYQYDTAWGSDCGIAAQGVHGNTFLPCVAGSPPDVAGRLLP